MGKLYDAIDDNLMAIIEKQMRQNEHRSEDDWREWRHAGNARSIDGLAGLMRRDAAE